MKKTILIFSILLIVFCFSCKSDDDSLASNSDVAKVEKYFDDNYQSRIQNLGWLNNSESFLDGSEWEGACGCPNGACDGYSFYSGNGAISTAEIIDRETIRLIAHEELTTITVRDLQNEYNNFLGFVPENINYERSINIINNTYRIKNTIPLGDEIIEGINRDHIRISNNLRIYVVAGEYEIQRNGQYRYGFVDLKIKIENER